MIRVRNRQALEGSVPVRVCFVSSVMASLLDPSLPPRHGGAELQMFLLGKELSRDPAVEVHFMVNEIPAGAVLPDGIEWCTFPPTIVRGVPIVSAVINIVRWTRALGDTNCDWFIQMSGGSLTFHVALARVLLLRRMAFWLSSDADVDGGLLVRTPKVQRTYLWARRHVDVVFAQHGEQQRALAHEGIQSVILRSGFCIRAERDRSGREIILWVASCQPLKQPRLFLELARRVPEAKFVMVMTPRDESYFKTIEEEARDIENLELLPGVPDVGLYYDRAIALVNLSTVEGFPNTFLEAAMSSTPVVSLNVDPESMLSDGAGVACGGDYEFLVRQVRLLVSDASMADRLGCAAREYVVERHDVVKTAETFKRALFPSNETYR